MNIKSWPKLIFSIILAQSAGIVGTFFTSPAIPSWYVFLNKPTFSPPNYIFGPVWVSLYTLIGISFYIIWVNISKKNSWIIKLFLFHLFLNSIWSIIFFGLKNLGLAFVVIVLMWLTLIYIIKIFYSINKLASYLLIPYLIWISFAGILNLTIWKLNPQNTVKNVFAQDFNFSKAREDYIFIEDNYKKDLSDFNHRKASYQKNETLSLKEELRSSTYKFVLSRDLFIKSYLTMLRMRTVESAGIQNALKESLFSKLDNEINWYDNRRNDYNLSTSLEDIINKSKEEDSRYQTDTLPIIYYTLAHISLGEARVLKNKHLEIYTSLRNESDQLIKLGRSDAELFDRWFKDIDRELNLIVEVEKKTETQIETILSQDEYKRKSGYENSIESLEPIKANLLKLNGFIMELENVIASKR